MELVAPAPDAILLSIPQAAQRLGISRSTVYRLIGSGELPTKKIGQRTLVHERDVRALAEVGAELGG